MRFPVIALASLLLLAAGCSHSKANVPSLPASHSYLSRALDGYVNKHPELAYLSVPELHDAPVQLVVEPGQARSVFEEALQVLKGKPSAEELQQAQADLSASCTAELEEACTFLRENFESPQRYYGKVPEFPREYFEKLTFATVVIRCQLGVDGRFRGCKLIERGPPEINNAALTFTNTARFWPAKLAGHPVEVSYTITQHYKGLRVEETPELRIAWARVRATHFPKSTPAWATLTGLLSRYAPEDPGLPEALKALHSLTPAFWWPANELAWLHVQAGRHAEAAPLAKRARASEPSNPYVLETHAAVLAATGQCEQALADQRQAVAKLPAEWPAPERERFTRTLQQYERQCAVTP